MAKRTNTFDWSEDTGLVKSYDGQKYVVKDNEKHYIPDPETKNAIGVGRSNYLTLTSLGLKKLGNGEPIESVRSSGTRLVRTKDSHDHIFMLFSWPSLHRRHVPDPETLDAMGRTQDEAELISERRMLSIPRDEALTSVRRWDPNLTRSIHGTTHGIINNIIGPVGSIIGSNHGTVSSKQKLGVSRLDRIFQIALVVLGSLFLALLVQYLAHRWNW